MCPELSTVLVFGEGDVTWVPDHVSEVCPRPCEIARVDVASAGVRVGMQRMPCHDFSRPDPLSLGGAFLGVPWVVAFALARVFVEMLL